MNNLLRALVLLALALPLHGQTASDWVQRAQLFAADPEFSLACRLVIHDQGGDERTRDLLVASRRIGGLSELLVEVTGPASARGLKFLQKRGPSAGSWLKTGRTIRRLPANGGTEPLFGSDFGTADFEPALEGWALVSTNGGFVQLERRTPVREVLTLRASDGLVTRRETWGVDGAIGRVYSVEEWSPQGRPSRVRLATNALSTWSEISVTEFRPGPQVAGIFAPGNL